ncbi:protein kinase [Saxibacter everestensis]|uniref:Protein kinase n=1 Tax=Saxibacter everestensis TaxID=2909229 RepID=A0ABY8QU64_9MICO|nr:protein kinase [Brevibacteriaceae bacterium ZFBP1038]
MADEIYVGGYRLAERLGQGGMGVVHRAVDADGAEVAVKVLHAHVAMDPEARRRLAREVRTLQRVRHPRVAEVIDAELEADRPFLVTQYVPGMSLADDVAEHGPFAEDELVHLGHGLLDALDAVHSAGIVHRDLKPANVMLLDGEPVVIDFGIAQVADEVQVTATGLVMGTPGYLSPEVAEGDPATAATDWWGWAATMAFAATGANPFGSGPLEAVLGRVQRGSADVADVPENFGYLLKACLHPDPERRPSGDEILDALVDIESGELPRLPTRCGIFVPPVSGSEPTTVYDQPPAAQTELMAAPRQADYDYYPSPPPPTQDSQYGQSGQGLSGQGMTNSLNSQYPPYGQSGQAAPTPQSAPYGQDGRQHQPYAPYGQVARQHPAPSQQAEYPGPRGEYPGHYPAQIEPPQPPPSRTGTIAALLLACISVAGLGPGVVLLLALVFGVIARTVGRVSRVREWKAYRQGPGSVSGMTTVGAIPGSLLLSLLVSVVAAILPLIAGLSGAILVWLAGADGLPAERVITFSLWAGAALATLTAWWGPGGQGLRRGTKVTLRAMTPGRLGASIAILIFLALALLGVTTALGGAAVTWWPLPESPLNFVN